MNTPQAPDPVATANAQTASNEQTAQYQQSLNQTNQITPYGSITYQQTGTSADGAPTSTATTTLSPQLQSLIDSNISNNTAESGIAGQLAGNAASTLSTPLDLDNLSQLPTLTAWNAATLDPQWARNDQNAAQTAYDQGLAPGSAGYAAEMQNEGTLKNQAYDQSNLANIGTAINATEQQYNEPLNALSALQSGSQVSQPGVGQTAAAPQTSVAGTNVAGIDQASYQDQLAASNATMGGLFGLGGTIGSGLMQGIGSAGGLAAFFSDRRLKRDISRVGTRRDGLGLYAYRYVWGGNLRCGPIAQEVRELYPEAVFDVGGFLAIDLGRLPH